MDAQALVQELFDVARQDNSWYTEEGLIWEDYYNTWLQEKGLVQLTEDQPVDTDKLEGIKQLLEGLDTMARQKGLPIPTISFSLLWGEAPDGEGAEPLLLQLASGVSGIEWRACSDTVYSLLAAVVERRIKEELL